MTFQLEVNVDIGPVEQKLRGLVQATTDFREPFTDVIDPLVSEFFTEQFATAGQAGGTPWAPLRPATIAYKARFNRAGMGILRFFNRLWASLTKPGSPDGIRIIEKDRYVRGTSVPYARFHQTGFTVKGWGRVRFKSPIAVAARPLVPDPFPPRLIERFQQAIDVHLAQAAGDA